MTRFSSVHNSDGNELRPSLWFGPRHIPTDVTITLQHPAPNVRSNYSAFKASFKTRRAHGIQAREVNANGKWAKMTGALRLVLNREGSKSKNGRNGLPFKTAAVAQGVPVWVQEHLAVNRKVTNSMLDSLDVEVSQHSLAANKRMQDAEREMWDRAADEETKKAAEKSSRRVLRVFDSIHRVTKLSEERDPFIKEHRAAKVIQTSWRSYKQREQEEQNHVDKLVSRDVQSMLGQAVLAQVRQARRRGFNPLCIKSFGKQGAGPHHGSSSGFSHEGKGYNGREPPTVIVTKKVPRVRAGFGSSAPAVGDLKLKKAGPMLPPEPEGSPVSRGHPGLSHGSLARHKAPINTDHTSCCAPLARGAGVRRTRTESPCLSPTTVVQGGRLVHWEQQGEQHSGRQGAAVGHTKSDASILDKALVAAAVQKSHLMQDQCSVSDLSKTSHYLQHSASRIEHDLKQHDQFQQMESALKSGCGHAEQHLVIDQDTLQIKKHDHIESMTSTEEAPDHPPSGLSGGMHNQVMDFSSAIANDAWAQTHQLSPRCVAHSHSSPSNAEQHVARNLEHSHPQGGQALQHEEQQDEQHLQYQRKEQQQQQQRQPEVCLEQQEQQQQPDHLVHENQPQQPQQQRQQKEGLHPEGSQEDAPHEVATQVNAFKEDGRQAGVRSDASQEGVPKYETSVSVKELPSIPSDSPVPESLIESAPPAAIKLSAHPSSKGASPPNEDTSRTSQEPPPSTLDSHSEPSSLHCLAQVASDTIAVQASHSSLMKPASPEAPSAEVSHTSTSQAEAPPALPPKAAAKSSHLNLCPLLESSSSSGAEASTPGVVTAASYDLSPVTDMPGTCTEEQVHSTILNSFRQDSDEITLYTASLGGTDSAQEATSPPESKSSQEAASTQDTVVAQDCTNALDFCMSGVGTSNPIASSSLEEKEEEDAKDAQDAQDARTAHGSALAPDMSTVQHVRLPACQLVSREAATPILHAESDELTASPDAQCHQSDSASSFLTEPPPHTHKEMVDSSEMPSSASSPRSQDTKPPVPPKPHTVILPHRPHRVPTQGQQVVSIVGISGRNEEPALSPFMSLMPTKKTSDTGLRLGAVIMPRAGQQSAGMPNTGMSPHQVAGPRPSISASPHISNTSIPSTQSSSGLLFASGLHSLDPVAPPPKHQSTISILSRNGGPPAPRGGTGRAASPQRLATGRTTKGPPIPQAPAALKAAAAIHVARQHGGGAFDCLRGRKAPGSAVPSGPSAGLESAAKLTCPQEEDVHQYAAMSECLQVSAHPPQTPGAPGAIPQPSMSAPISKVSQHRLHSSPLVAKPNSGGIMRSPSLPRAPSGSTLPVRCSSEGGSRAASPTTFYPDPSLSSGPRQVSSGQVHEEGSFPDFPNLVPTSNLPESGPATKAAYNTWVATPTPWVVEESSVHAAPPEVASEPTAQPVGGMPSTRIQAISSSKRTCPSVKQEPGMQLRVGTSRKSLSATLQGEAGRQEGMRGSEVDLTQWLYVSASRPFASTIALSEESTGGMCALNTVSNTVKHTDTDSVKGVMACGPASTGVSPDSSVVVAADYPDAGSSVDAGAIVDNSLGSNSGTEAAAESESLDPLPTRTSVALKTSPRSSCALVPTQPSSKRTSSSSGAPSTASAQGERFRGLEMNAPSKLVSSADLLSVSMQLPPKKHEPGSMQHLSQSMQSPDQMRHAWARMEEAKQTGPMSTRCSKGAFAPSAVRRPRTTPVKARLRAGSGDGGSHAPQMHAQSAAALPRSPPQRPGTTREERRGAGWVTASIGMPYTSGQQPSLSLVGNPKGSRVRY